MKWRFIIGDDKKPIISVIGLPLVLIIIGVYICVDCFVSEYHRVVAGEGLNWVGIFFPGLFPGLYGLYFWGFFLTVYQMDADGIHIRSLYFWRNIDWSEIKAIRIYHIYQGKLDQGEFIFCILNPDKKLRRLTIDPSHMMNRNYVIFNLTDERLREIKEYCVIPVERGRQDRDKCLD